MRGDASVQLISLLGMRKNRRLLQETENEKVRLVVRQSTGELNFWKSNIKDGFMLCNEFMLCTLTITHCCQMNLCLVLVLFFFYD